MRKYVILCVFVVGFFSSLFIYQFIVFNYGKLRITVCDVGQGDAVYIRTPHRQNVLFDGGPDESVIKCLSQSMPFWDRSFDLVLLSHPHADHLNGLVEVFKRYKVKAFATEDLANTSTGYKQLRSEVKKAGLDWQTLVDGDRLRFPGGVGMEVVGPTSEFLRRTSGANKIINTSEFASLEIYLTYGNFSLLLTGDSQSEEMGEAVSGHNLNDITLLQEPHHGSRTGITSEIIARLHPQVATISVGANNHYGHPAPNVLTILQNAGVSIHRTDKEGDIRIKTDGKTYSIE